jgi:hypothetical protein
LCLQVLKIVLDLERLERLLEYDSEKSQLPPPSMGVPLVPLTARTSEWHVLESGLFLAVTACAGVCFGALAV